MGLVTPGHPRGTIFFAPAGLNPPATQSPSQGTSTHAGFCPDVPTVTRGGAGGRHPAQEQLLWVLGAGCWVLAAAPRAPRTGSASFLLPPTCPAPDPFLGCARRGRARGGGKLRQGAEPVGLGLLTCGGQGAAPHGTPSLRRGEIGVSEAALGAERCGERSRICPPPGDGASTPELGDFGAFLFFLPMR